MMIEQLVLHFKNLYRICDGLFCSRVDVVQVKLQYRRTTNDNKRLRMEWDSHQTAKQQHGCKIVRMLLVYPLIQNS